MTDSAPDNKRQRHSMVWYVGWALVVYVVSFVPAVVCLSWLVHWGVPVDGPLLSVFRMIYWPIEWVLTELLPGFNVWLIRLFSPLLP